jgi:DNA protecting protein DprA
MEEIIFLLALNRIMNYDCKKAAALIEYAGSASALFSIGSSELTDALGKRYRFISELSNKNHLKWAEEEFKWATSKGVHILTPYDPDGGYPQYLLECNDRPIILYKIGPADLNNRQTVSIVGTRRSTRYGEQMCGKILYQIREMGISPIIVSGLAFGIDICAHRAAIENNFATVAVSACGPDKIYPASHTTDARKIAKTGAIITEFPRGTEGLKLNFLRRNRIIAGISQATIVIESSEKGGAMLTASLAHSYSREVFALPGRVSDPSSTGCNLLISKNIATIIYSAEDMVEKLGWREPGSSNKSDHTGEWKEIQPQINFQNGDEEKILVTLRLGSELHIDELSTMTNLNISSLSAALLKLEMSGIIMRLPGERYTLL